MIRVSPEEADLLLKDWKERRLWIGTFVALGEDAREEHKFWAQVVDVPPGAVKLAGEHALVDIPLEKGAVREYSEVSEAPPNLRAFFSEFAFCLTIRSQRVLAFLFGERPKKE